MLKAVSFVVNSGQNYFFPTRTKMLGLGYVKTAQISQILLEYHNGRQRQNTLVALDKFGNTDLSAFRQHLFPPLKLQIFVATQIL